MHEQYRSSYPYAPDKDSGCQLQMVIAKLSRESGGHILLQKIFPTAVQQMGWPDTDQPFESTRPEQ